MKRLVAKLKPYLRWAILGGTLFFVGSALRSHWQEVLSVRMDATGWACLAIALGVTLLAHIWSGWVWSWILQELGQPVAGSWGVLVYLQTNIAKYLPGNIWHFYGRVWASQAAGLPLAAATVSVLMEPLLMVASALAIALLSLDTSHRLIQLGCLSLSLMLLHPRVLNPVLQFLGRWKRKPQSLADASTQSGVISNEASLGQPATLLQIKRYPIKPFLGELAFVGLRGLGFVLTMVAFTPVAWNDVPLLLGAFSVAWLLGLIVPGSPGGLGVFEATAIALLRQSSQSFPPGIVLSTVAVYRLVSLLAEAGGAGLAWLDGSRPTPPSKEL